MLLSFSPLVVVLFVTYCLLLWLQFSLDSFIVLWVNIELITFVFMGISILLVGSASSGMGNTLYFITQSMLSLLLLLIGSIMHSTLVSLIIFSILLVNLGVFPFWSWYFSSVLCMPHLVFVLALSFQKLPVLVLWVYFHYLSDGYILLFCLLLLVFSMLISFIVACYSTDLRSVLLSTSIGNNAWFVFSSNAGELVLLSFTLIYAISLLGSLSSTIPVSSLFLANLSGLPPFPIFFINLFVLTSSIAVLGVSSFVLWWLVMLFSVVGSVAYLRVVFLRLLLVGL